MNRTIIITITAIAAALTISCSKKQPAVADDNNLSLKEMYGDKFLIGGAVNVQQVAGEDSLGQDIAKRHFNTIVAENCMKSEKINPSEGEYFWDDADAFVKFGEDNGMSIVGHCLIWHSQLAPWFPVDDKGNLVDKETLKKRMKDHITTMMTRYKGRVHGWDVVNEAIEDDGSYRNSPFFQILGEEYIPLAFQYAVEADPEAELYINDYGMDKPGRRDTYVRIVNDLKQRGLRVDAIGMQAHIGMDYPEFNEFEAAIDSFATTGCKVMITEWDMSALPTVTQSADVSESAETDVDMNPYPDGLPAEVDSIWNARMEQVMRILINHSDVISRVNAWGVSDGESWRNDWPINGRTDYPLLFDRNHQMKPFLMNALKEKQS